MEKVFLQVCSEEMWNGYCERHVDTECWLTKSGVGNLRPVWTFNRACIKIFVIQDRTWHRVITKLRGKQILETVSQKKHLSFLLIVISPIFLMKTRAKSIIFAANRRYSTTCVARDNKYIRLAAPATNDDAMHLRENIVLSCERVKFQFYQNSVTTFALL